MMGKTTMRTKLIGLVCLLALAMPSVARALCTDYPATGAASITWTAGHTYCFAKGTTTFSSAQAINVNNVTILCTNPTEILQQTTSGDDLFDVTGTSDKIIGCTLDGDSNNDILVNATASTALVVEGVTFQNYGTGYGVESLESDQLFINQWNCTAEPGVCIYLNPSTGNITNTTIENGYGSLTATSGTTNYIVELANASGNTISKVLVTDNRVLGRNGAGNAKLIYFGGAVTPNIHGVQFTDNTCEATSTLYACYCLYGIDFSSIKGNLVRDNANLLVLGFDFGDLYDSSVAGNTILLTSGEGSGPCIAGFDVSRNSFVGNTCKNPNNDYTFASAGILLGPSAAPVSYNTVADNVIHLDTVASTCIEVDSGANSYAANDNDVHGNQCIGTGTASQIGVLITTGGTGTATGNKVHDNTFDDVATGAETDAGTTSTRIADNLYDTVTTPVVCNGTTPYCYNYDAWFSISGTPTGSQIFPGVCAETLTFPANTAGAEASCGTNPSESDAYLLKVNGATVATLTLSTSCVLSLSSQAAFNCTASQRLELDAPATVSGANIAFTIPATR